MPEDLAALMTASPNMLLRYATLHQKAATILRAWAAAATAHDQEVVAACVAALSDLASAQTQGGGSVLGPSA